MSDKTKLFIDAVRAKNHINHIDYKGNLIYCYNNVNYTKSSVKVVIVCHIHGYFEQTPNNHLNGKGCKYCGNTRRGKAQTTTLEDFIAKADLIHNKKYDYSKSLYVKSRVKIEIICPVHGSFYQMPVDHMLGSGCNDCGNIKIGKRLVSNTSDFVAKAIALHGDKYTYDKVDYVTNHVKVIIKCELHGDFEQTPNIHLNGGGCPSCAFITSGYTKSNFKDRCLENNNGLGILYIIRCFNDTEVFYKIGITSKGIKARFNSSKAMPYNIEVIHEVHREANKVYNMENYLLKALAKYSYQPLIPFSGQTECISSLEPFYKLFRDKLAA